MKYFAIRSILALCFAFTTLESAHATPQPRNDSGIFVQMGLAAAALTVPLGVNTYSALSESPVAPLWHWSGYGIGGLSFVLGSFGMADNIGKDDSTKTWVASGFMGYGLCHMAAAYFASEIKPESNAGVLAPLVSVGDQGERQLGLTWMRRF